MKIFCMSDIHGAVGAIEKAGPLISQADLVVVAGDITRLKNREEAEQVISAIERFNRRILAVHGNWDHSEVCAFLEEQGYSLHGQGRVIAEVGFFGLGGSSPTPMQTATEYSEEEMTRYLQDGYKTVRNCAQIVLISHCPPQGVRDQTYLDLPGGSQSVRKFLEEHRIDLCLCGHIHEAGGIETFHGTIVANGGSFKRGNGLNITIGKDIRVKKESIPV
mgnify:FL=1